MVFKLDECDYEVLSANVEEAVQYIEKVKKVDSTVFFEVDDKDIQEVQLLINDEIVLNGMNNQDEVNKLGKELYKVYDEILFQKNNK